MIRYNGYVICKGGYWLKAGGDPYNPLNLPPFTIRLKYRDNVTPDFEFGTGVQVSSSPNIWDLTYNNTDWGHGLTWNNHDDLIEVLGGNTTGVTSMNDMFTVCRNLSKVSLFDTSTVTVMAEMFDRCTSLTEIPLYDTHNVTSMRYMLDYFPGTTVPLFDTSNVTDMSWMFASCPNLTDVPSFNTSKVTNMFSMFSGCYSLVTIPLLDTSNVTNMNMMFDHCTHLDSLPLLDTSKVTSLSSFCNSCWWLSTIPDFNLNSVTTMNGAFYNCYNVSTGALNLYQKAAGIGQVTEHSNTFRYCGRDTVTGAAELAQIPTSWGGTMAE